MSSKRPPSAPPRIEGFEYVSLVGSGGFSDVFLYQQQRPRRRVAVKVLLSERTASQRAAFDAEADLMATLSTHPSIVTMYEASIAEDGRPYLAMEYCSRPNLGSRYRTERFSVAEALRVAVQIAGAVETAHRAGILHRDIKPANILVTDYGHPVLTDFGISSTLDDARAAEGMSIPWSPPESFGDPPVSGVATDVWALAATLYTLLAGRSPFEVPGGPNGSADLVARIERAPLQPTGRDDVPASLERVLATAMAKRPESRYPSVLALARALQHVQTELRLAVTPIDLLDDSGEVAEEEPDDEPGTRLRSVTSIDPAAAPVAPRPASTPAWSPQAEASEATALREVRAVGDDAVADSTMLRAAAPDDAAAPTAEPGSARRGLGIVVGVAVALVAVAGVLWGVLGGGDEEPAADAVARQTESPTGPPRDNIGSLVPAVRGLEGTVAGDRATFTWQPPTDSQDGDRYAWRVLSLTEENLYQPIEGTTVTVPLSPDGQTCVEVVVVRSGKQSASPQDACVS
ncbi:serine/threonine-protein kinase [Puerhibacterium puerhi]|uniref:serine/threonine-protein kinase n=1 Tax=Puerhibacterium puerhi TaxID=2692623 RepID=UPI00135BD317|nr:serine/threonine-protein kinase [Puerhibacterium puerhi]